MLESDKDLSDWRRTEQWVASVIDFSFQHSNDAGSAKHIIGPPKVFPRHGHNSNTWTVSRRANTTESISVEFERTVYPEQFHIYETFNPGALVKISVRDGKDNSEWETVWKTDKPQHQKNSARIFSVSCKKLSFKRINQVQLEVNRSAVGDWYQIDSIKLIGYLSHQKLFSNEVLMNFKDFLTDTNLSDVQFQLDNGQIISSYRNVLSLRSIYFNELFKEYPVNYKEPIKISNISFDVFKQILNFVYTDKIDENLTIEIYLELMRKSEEFFLSSIYVEAFDYLKLMINKTNVLDILIQSGIFANDEQDQKLFLQDLANFCLKFIQENRRDVYTYGNLKKLTKEMLVKLVEIDCYIDRN